MNRFFSQSGRQRTARIESDFLLAYVFSFCFLLFIFRIILSFHPVFATQLRKGTQRQSSAGLVAFSADHLAFTDYSTVEVRLQKNNPVAILIVPDFESDTFFAARCSGIDDLPSGYLHFVDGVPIEFRALDSKSSDSDQCLFEFNPVMFQRPERELVFLTIPSNERLGNVVTEIALVRTDNIRTKLVLTHPSTYLFSAVLSFLLGLVVTRVDRRTYNSDYIARRNIRSRRILATLFLAGLNLPICIHLVLSKGHFAVILPVFSCCLFFWSATRKSALKNWKNRPSGKLPGVFKLRSLAFLAFFTIAIVLLVHAKIFISLRLLETRAAEKAVSQKGQGAPGVKDTIILCLGGSSTAGTPYAPDEGADYPAQLERILREKKFPVRVVNAGVNAATTYHVSKNLPEMLEVIRPDIVTWNYLNNDEGGMEIDDLRSRLRKKIGLSSPLTPVERYRLRLTQFVQRVRDIGASPVFVLEPHFIYVYLGQDPLQNSRRILWNVAKAEGVDVIDPTPAFRRQKDWMLFWDNNVHPTAIGYRLLAQTIAEKLEPLLTRPALKPL